MRFVVLGDPVDHSRSPAIHTAALAATGIEGTYAARRSKPPAWSDAVDEVRYGRLTGANVTMPHKQIAFELCDRVSESALRSGAVNTLVRRDGEVWGYNTDVDGIRSVWADRELPAMSPVLILGTGGAAAGALTALADRTVHVTGRRDDAAPRPPRSRPRRRCGRTLGDARRGCRRRQRNTDRHGRRSVARVAAHLLFGLLRSDLRSRREPVHSPGPKARSPGRGRQRPAHRPGCRFIRDMDGRGCAGRCHERSVLRVSRMMQ